MMLLRFQVALAADSCNQACYDYATKETEGSNLDLVYCKGNTPSPERIQECEKIQADYLNALGLQTKNCLALCDMPAPETVAPNTNSVTPASKNPLGFTNATNRLEKVSGSYGKDQLQSLPQIVGNVVNITLTILGVLFFVLVVYGGYIWMIARGEVQEAERASSIIKMAVIGMVVVLAAYAISYFVFARLISVTGVNI